jgi:bifunctional UDP-N-acetylglucosamine pyrophosphorylase / glucosamine-1-phosphate N-acetyltransferase
MEILHQNLVITILAGGEGKRMKSNLPKVLVDFNNKPMLIRILEECLKLNPKKIIIITGQHHDKIVTKVKSNFFDIWEKVSIKFIKQEKQLGTGHAVCCCLNLYNDEDNVLILNGDTPNIKYQILEKYIAQLYLKGFTNGLITCEYKDPTGYGRVILDNESFIEKIIEEKDATDEEKKVKLINSGIYYIKGFLLKELIPHINDNNVQKEFYLTDIISLCYSYKSHKLYNMTLNSNHIKYILGVNTKEQLKELEEYVKENKNIEL